MTEEQHIADIKTHFTRHFDIFNGLDIYYWIASGCVRDFFISVNPNDIDMFFPDLQSRETARNRILQLGGKKLRTLPRGEKIGYNNMRYDLVCWDGTGDPACKADTPQDMIKWFDYTVEMAALDSRGEFFCHPRFYDDVVNKRLIRNPIRDLYPRMNNLRLLKYLKKGYTIEQDQLIQFLQDQEDTFLYRRGKSKCSTKR